MGGTNNSDNIIRVNIAMHAFLHKCLYEEYGNWQDEVAWKALSGQITTAEANILATKNSNTGKIPWNKGLPSPTRGMKRPEHSKFLSKGQPHKKKKYEVIHPNGKIEIVIGLIEFCKKYNINASNLCQVAKGKKQHANGFKAKEIKK